MEEREREAVVVRGRTANNENKATTTPYTMDMANIERNIYATRVALVYFHVFFSRVTCNPMNANAK